MASGKVKQGFNGPLHQVFDHFVSRSSFLNPTEQYVLPLECFHRNYIIAQN
jgi:hypothetical protein